MKPALILLALTSIAFAQGNLTPPGAPGLTMKSLDQIEPRIPLTATHTPGNATCVFRITQPGSYYLPGNLKPPAGKHGILIALMTPGVVELDLMGFTVDGSDAGPAASAVLNNNDLPARLRVHNGTISNFAGTACLHAYPMDGGNFVYQKIIWLMNGAAVNTTGRLLLSDSSISGSGIPIQAGNDSVLSGVEISGSGSAASPLVSAGDRSALETLTIMWEFAAGSAASAMRLGPGSRVSGLTARLSGGTFSGPVLANSSGFTEVSGLSLELTNVTAPCVCNSFNFGGIKSPRDTATGQATGILGTTYGGNGEITAHNSTFSNALVIIPPSMLNNKNPELAVALALTGTTTTPSVVHVEADNFQKHWEIIALATATVSGAVIDVAASGTTTRASIRGGNVGVRLSSGSGNTVEACHFTGLLTPAAAIQISGGVTNSLVRNNRASRLAGDGVLVVNNGGPTNFIAPILTTPAQLNANTNPFANIVH